VKRSSRPTCNLSEPVSQRLNAYALAAGAAGVGMLALTHPAEAKIVHTLANIPIVQNGGLVELDLNHDGINDFQFSFAYTTEKRRAPEGFHQSSMTVAPVQQSNGVVGIQKKGYVPEASALGHGKTVGPKSPFPQGHSALSMFGCAGGTSCGGCGGLWLGKKEAYLGLKFVIKGEIHYGWAHVRFAGESSPTIVGYAYETIANKPIITGATKGPAEIDADQATSVNAPKQPATLAMLALGAPALSIWRREESAEPSQVV
jgi:hypothetical protein